MSGVMKTGQALLADMLEAEAATSRGRKHVRNEDAYIVNIEGGLFAVADGMGGHRDGHIASQAVVALLEHAVDPTATFEQRIEAATKAIETANRALYSQTLATPGADICGSTAITLVVGDGYACCLWVGDSRLYLFRDSWLYLVSEDHVAEGGSLTRAVGSAAEIEVDRRIIEIREHDVFLLCSDGLLKGMDEDALADLMGAVGHAPADRLLAKSIAGGSSDDVTVILVWVATHDE